MFAEMKREKKVYEKRIFQKSRSNVDTMLNGNHCCFMLQEKKVNKICNSCVFDQRDGGVVNGYLSQKNLKSRPENFLGSKKWIFGDFFGKTGFGLCIKHVK